MNITLDSVCPPHPQSWHDARKLGIGGSDANIICSGDTDKIAALWQQKCELAQSPDLSRILPVLMGNVTEDLNLAMLAEKTGLNIPDTLAPAIA